MRAFLRVTDGLRRFSGRPIRCPSCHHEGYDRGGDHAAFEDRGRLGGHPVRKCLACGSGLIVRGHRFEAIASDSWQALEKRFEELTREP
jgi:hypothetical protein